MNTVWNFKIELKSANIFSELESQYHIEIPNNLKSLILETNAASPDKHLFMVGTDEKVFGSMLSFNKDEEDTDTIFTALKVIDSNKIFPFAIDPFGNYICLDLSNKDIVFYNHESSQIASTQKHLKEFMDSLY